MWQRIARDGACKWCQSQQGQSENYKDINFARHEHCRCAIINTEQGKLYVGNKKAGVWKEAISFDKEISNSIANVIKGKNVALDVPKLKLKLVDVKDDMLQRSTPGKGKIIGKFNDPNPNVVIVDTKEANWIINNFGGTIKPIKRSSLVRSADCHWSSSLFKSKRQLEFKSSTGSKSSINSQMRSAKGQIDSDDVLLINLSSPMKRNINEVLEHIKREAYNFNLRNVIVKQDNKLISFLKLK